MSYRETQPLQNIYNVNVKYNVSQFQNSSRFTVYCLLIGTLFHLASQKNHTVPFILFKV